MPGLKPPAAKRTPATARRCRYSHGLIRRLITVTDREGVVLSPGACIGMPPTVGYPVTYLNDMGRSSRAALAVRLAFSSPVVGDAPVHHGQLHRHIVDFFGRYAEQVLGEHGQVGVLARLERAGYVVQA